MESLKRRSRLIAGFLAGVVTVAALAVAVFSSGPGATAQTPEVTATATATAIASPSPVAPPPAPTQPPMPPVPSPGTTSLRQVDNAFSRTVTQPGQPLPEGHGISFTDTTTGVTETYSLINRLESEYVIYQASDDNRWVIAPYQATIFDRETGQAFAWGQDQPPLITAWGDRLLFFAHPNGFRLLDENGELVAEIAMPDGQGFSGAKPVVSADGTRLAFAFADAVGILDLTSAAPAFVMSSTGSALNNLAAMGLQTTNGGSEIVLTLRYQRDGQVLNEMTVKRFDWDGNLLSQIELESNDVRLSPDGKLMAWETTVREDGYAEPYGGMTRDWQAVVIGTATGQPLFQVRGASLCMPNELPQAWMLTPGQRWLADGSAITLNTRAGAVLLDVQSRTIRDTVFGASLHAAPGRPDLLASGIQTVTAAGAARPGPDATDYLAFPELAPWGASATELRFSRAPQEIPQSFCEVGAGGAPEVIAYPLPAPVERLRIAADGDCLNQRSLPGPTAQVTDCIEDGAELVITPTTFSPYASDVIAIATPAGGLFKCGAGIDPSIVVTVSAYHGWVHVTTPKGAQGWVSSLYVDWLD